MQNPRFTFIGYHYAPETGRVTLNYRYGEDDDFQEIFDFPPAQNLSTENAIAIENAVRLLFYVCGVSYYKIYATTDIHFEPAVIPDAKTAAFIRDVYLNGLGEFAYQNGITMKDRVTFKGTIFSNSAPAAQSVAPQSCALVPVGGGKDSIVTIESLRHHHKKCVLFSVGSSDTPAKPIADTIRIAAMDHIHVVRKLSPNMNDINARAGVMNGHIPITAIISIAAIITALIKNYDAVILSNEKSSSVGNVVVDGADINHQYSKSLAFETLLHDYVANHIATDLSYFSYLRPWSEIAIAQKFATLDAYHAVFHSCNKAFYQDATMRQSHWCCDCPKCRFVFLALAPFMPRNKLIAIFGNNILDDETQLDGFKELCGLSKFKPFECVGEIEECQSLLQTLSTMPEWQDDFIVSQCAPSLNGNAAPLPVFDIKDPLHFIPPRYDVEAL